MMQWSHPDINNVVHGKTGHMFAPRYAPCLSTHDTYQVCHIYQNQRIGIIAKRTIKSRIEVQGKCQWSDSDYMMNPDNHSGVSGGRV